MSNDEDHIARKLAPPGRQMTKADWEIINAGADILENSPTDQDRAYMARQLVQATLPHKNPGDVPAWVRKNGNLSLVVQPGWNAAQEKSFGYPYGTIPRLLLFWLTTEAVKTKTTRIELGNSLTEFMRAIGMNPDNGTGKRSDARRLRNQMDRLFQARISFQAVQQTPTRKGQSWVNMQVSDKGVLWWSQRDPDQRALWGSWIELTPQFFAAITSSPVPVDYRALRALKRSALALDLYAWLTYEAYRAHKTGNARFVAWHLLMQQMGAEYTGDEAIANFRKKAKNALRKIRTVYPGLKLGRKQGGIEVLPSSFTAIQALPGPKSSQSR